MTAYKHWLIENFKTVDDIAAEIYAEILIDKNPQAQDLISDYLQSKGETKIVQETFYLTAQKLLDDYEKEKAEVTDE